MNAQQMIQEELDGLAQAVHAALGNREPTHPAEVVLTALAAVTGRAIELGAPTEVIEGVIAKVMKLAPSTDDDGDDVEDNAVTATLDGWYEALRLAALENIDDKADMPTVFSFVLAFAAGPALGAGVKLDDAFAIVKRCADQLAARVATAAAPPTPPPAPAPAAPKRWDVPS